MSLPDVARDSTLRGKQKEVIGDPRGGLREQDSHRVPEGRAKLRERVAVEHALAHVGHWQGRRARYRGTRKNLFDHRRVTVVYNLHVIARQLDDSDCQPAA